MPSSLDSDPQPFSDHIPNVTYLPKMFSPTSTPFGYPPIFFASQNQARALWLAAQHKNEAVVQLLIDAKADVHTRHKVFI